MGTNGSEDGGNMVVTISAVLCLGLAAGLIFFFHSQAGPVDDVDEAWFKQPKVSIDERELEASRDAHYGSESLEDKAAYLEYRTNYQAANLLMFAEPSATEYERMNKLLAISSTDALTEIRDHKRFTKIGEPIFANCAHALDDLLDDVVEQRLSMDAALAGDLGEDYDSYKRNCGHVMPILRKHELVTADGEWRRPQYGPVLFDVLQRWRFASQISDRVLPHDGVSPVDYREWMEWRLLVPESFSTAERYEKLNDARSKPPEGLNLDRAEAYIAASARDWNRARKAYNRVCELPEATGQDHIACEWLKRFEPPTKDEVKSDGDSKVDKGR